jgi:bifunctional UDP-N-acetylglucosamine pyrophosphorylase/glucosamine-1-phosphate N-acetyltransferase
MPELHIVVLAAGKGTRMKSALPKVLHRVAGLPMIDYVLDAAARLSPRSTVVVVGHEAAQVQTALAWRSGLTIVVQEPQLGTAHALLTTEPVLRGRAGTLLLLSGDVPLLAPATLDLLVSRHASTGAALTMVTAVPASPEGYGRIVRSGGRIARVVEDKDATPEEAALTEVNAGIYAFRLEGLFDAVRSIGAGNAQGEYYLPDLVALCRRQGLGVETMTVADPDEVRGINSRSELAAAARAVRAAKNAALMASGVTLEDPATTYVDRDVEVGADTVIRPGVSLEGRTVIGAGCQIHSGVRIVDSQVGDRVTIHDHCVLTGVTVAEEASIGPFAHLRGAAAVGRRAKVGNFVELKKTVLGEGSKAMHLAYLGDAEIGASVNVGAGTITCNYDGERKHVTRIGDRAFIGSDSQLVAPIEVGEGAYVGSGTTVRENVPPGALAVSAGKQRNFEGWAERRKQRRG